MRRTSVLPALCALAYAAFCVQGVYAQSGHEGHDHGQQKEDHPKGEHPKGEHPKGEHPHEGGEDAMADMMAEFMKAAAPGDHHKHIAQLEGSWTMEVKHWMDPAQPPQTSTGTAERKLIMGGRCLVEEIKGDFGGMPFEGLALLGYDNQKQKYWGTWIDNFGTGLSTSEGTCDASGKKFEFTATMSNPMTGQTETRKETMTIVNANKNVLEMFATGPDGKEFREMEITFTRK